jgi:hypothetical protein
MVAGRRWLFKAEFDFLSVLVAVRPPISSGGFLSDLSGKIKPKLIGSFRGRQN